MVDRSDVSHFLSSVNSGSSSVMKPFSNSTLRQSQENSFENSPTSSGKSKRYPSATEALQAYISDFESSHPHMKYSRNVSKLLPSKTTLKGSSRNADIKTEINRYKVKKLIDRSYREILRADNERQKAKALLATTRLNDSSSLISGQSTDISLNTDALLSAPPHPYPTRRQRNTLNRLKSGSLEDLASRRIQMPQRMASSYHTPSNTMQSSTPTKTGNTAQSTSPVNRGRPAPSWIDDLDSVAGHPAPSWIQDLDSSITHPVPSWIQDLDTASCAAPSWVQDIDVSNISTITQSSHQPWDPLSSHRLNSQPSEDSILLRRYASTSDLLMSDASDWPLDETEHLLDFDMKTQQHQEDESKILTTPEKHKIEDVFHREKKYRDENYRFGKYKDDSAITSKVGKKMEFKYGNYSRDDSDLGSVTRYFRRSGYKRPLQSMQNLGNTSYSKRSVGNEQFRFSWSAQSRDKSRTPSKTDRGKYGSNLTRSGHDFGVDIASMDTDTLVNQAPLPALLNCSNSTDADNTINDTMIEEAIARARKKCHVDLNTSPLTEDVLDGDRSWEKTVPLRKYPRAGSGSTPLQAASKTGIIDKFLEDCMHSDQENERKASGGESPRLTGGEQPGPVETLKKMLFKLQSVAADDDDNTNNGTSTPDDLLSLSTVNKEKFDIEPGGKSLLRAMEHLSRLKTLVYSDSETASQKSNSSSTNSSQR